MFFRQVLHEDLGCASYVIADGGEAAVVDPKWDIDDYLALAEEHGFASRTSSRRTTTPTTCPGRAGWDGHRGDDPCPQGRGRRVRARPLADGDSVSVGEVTITALSTPGHWPEHTSYVIADASRGGEPWLVITGDSLFVATLPPRPRRRAGRGRQGPLHSLASSSSSTISRRRGRVTSAGRSAAAGG